MLFAGDINGDGGTGGRGRPAISEVKIREIYLGFLAGEPKTEMEARIGVDRQTIYKYVRKAQAMPEEQVYALINQTKTHFCRYGHTALKCLVCGNIADNISSEEFKEIVRLRRRVRELEARLDTRHEVPSSPNLDNPVVRVSG